MNDNETGILVFGRARPTIERDSITHNAPIGISYVEKADGVARGNDCSGNGQGGISVTDAAQPRAEGNVCDNNVYFGIGYVDASGGTAPEDRCVGSTFSGILVSGSAVPTLKSNSWRFNGSFGGLLPRGDTCRHALVPCSSVCRDAPSAGVQWLTDCDSIQTRV